MGRLYRKGGRSRRTYQQAVEGCKKQAGDVKVWRWKDKEKQATKIRGSNELVSICGKRTGGVKICNLKYLVREIMEWEE